MNYYKFPDNKYTRWYIQLVESRANQAKTQYQTEEHHIFPKSIFGDNNKLVTLTHREHYIAHLLLWKMFAEGTKERQSMAIALNCMGGMTNTKNCRIVHRVPSSIHSKARKEFVQAQSDKRKAYLADTTNYELMVKTNQSITSTKEWREQRSNRQKILSANKDYTAKRLAAMNTPEARNRAIRSQRKAIEAMTPEERKLKYSRVITDKQKEQISKAKTGQVYIYKDGKRSVADKDKLDEYRNDGWQTFYDINSDIMDKLYNGNINATEASKIIGISLSSLLKQFQNIFDMKYSDRVSEVMANKSYSEPAKDVMYTLPKAVKKVYTYKGNERKRIPIEDIQKYTDDGWLTLYQQHYKVFDKVYYGVLQSREAIKLTGLSQNQFLETFKKQYGLTVKARTDQIKANNK